MSADKGVLPLSRRPIDLAVNNAARKDHILYVFGQEVVLAISSSA